MGHIDFINNHPFLNGLEQFKSCFIDFGSEKIEIEADIWAKNYMKLSKEKYIECIEIIKDELKEKYKNDEWMRNSLLKVLNGRVKHVLRRSP